MSDNLKNILAAIIVFIIVLVAGSLIFWGIGNLIILVFRIDYLWTFLHGLVTMLIYLILRGLFNNERKD